MQKKFRKINYSKNSGNINTLHEPILFITQRSSKGHEWDKILVSLPLISVLDLSRVYSPEYL